MYSIRLFVKIILFIYLYGGRQHSRSCTLHVNVLFLCFCLRFPTYVFFFSLLPFVFSREVGSLHLFVSRCLSFFFVSCPEKVQFCGTKKLLYSLFISFVCNCLLLYLLKKSSCMWYCALLLNFKMICMCACSIHIRAISRPLFFD